MAGEIGRRAFRRLSIPSVRRTTSAHPCGGRLRLKNRPSHDRFTSKPVKLIGF